MERCRMVFSGSGGQGVITAAIILAEAAVLHEELTAVQTQAYGAAARGGATRSDVIISDVPINFPKVIQPNVLVCLTQEAYNKFYDIIRPGGLMITDTRYVQPQLKVDAVQRQLPLYETVVDKIGKPIVFTEMGAGAKAGHHGEPDEIWTEEFQADIYRRQVEMIRAGRSGAGGQIAGMSPWILKDFRAPLRVLPAIRMSPNS